MWFSVKLVHDLSVSTLSIKLPNVNRLHTKSLRPSCGPQLDIFCLHAFNSFMLVGNFSHKEAVFLLLLGTADVFVREVSLETLGSGIWCRLMTRLPLSFFLYLPPTYLAFFWRFFNCWSLQRLPGCEKGILVPKIIPKTSKDRVVNEMHLLLPAIWEWPLWGQFSHLGTQAAWPASITVQEKNGARKTIK